MTRFQLWLSHLLTFRRSTIEKFLYSWDNVPADDKFDELCKLQRQAGGPNAGIPGTENATKEFSILTEQHLLDKTINNNNDNNNNNNNNNNIHNNIYGDDDNRKKCIGISRFVYSRYEPDYQMLSYQYAIFRYLSSFWAL